MEKNGDMVGKITIKDFVIADKVFQDPVKSILTTKSPNSGGIDRMLLCDRLIAVRDLSCHMSGVMLMI